ncbi:MAG: nucleoside monophosphate kinase, partial [Candidatus Nanohaloarchaea archaeon]|nr:nucleoside monophosphate kinase [Candidatus Nanohaloarchaea archaeon]
LTGRRTCTECGATFHMEFDPPADDGTCTECGGELMQREDDEEDVVKKRLETYREKTAPLVDYYRERDMLAEVDGNPAIDEVWDSIRELLRDRFDVEG